MVWKRTRHLFISPVRTKVQDFLLPI